MNEEVFLTPEETANSTQDNDSQTDIKSEIQPESEEETLKIKEDIISIDSSQYDSIPNQSKSSINSTITMSAEPTQEHITELQRQEAVLKAEIENLQATHKKLSMELGETRKSMGKVVEEALLELQKRKQTLQIAIEQLEKRQERIRNEMRTSFAGASQELAIRVQGFKDYLTGSLQDLAAAAEQLELIPPQPVQPEPGVIERKAPPPTEEYSSDTPSFAQQQFQDTTKKIRRCIDQYRTQPDYYGPPWQLRRTFEPVHAERVSQWFFEQGGRGASRSMGSRLQNTLVASAIVSILHQLYDDRLSTLVLADTPERLGEWRRGLQDCLGIGRPDFGPDRGVALFESPQAIAQKAERLVKRNQMPFIIVDDSQEQISLALLQFPLWLAFAPDPRVMRDSYYDDF